MLGRNPARYLAPAALVVTAVGAYLIVTSNVNSSPKPAASFHSLDLSGIARSRYAHRRFYIVRPGDNLTRISTKTGVSVPRLEQMNPLLDPNNLQMGQRLRLRR
jgi:LysM repeat protein